MQPSVILARLVGPLLLVMGASLFLDRRAYRAMAEQFLASPPLLYLSGVLALLGGLAIVNLHNVWALGWPVLITVLGWLMLIGGAWRVLQPESAKRIGNRLVNDPQALNIIGAVILLIGAGLTLAGYLR